MKYFFIVLTLGLFGCNNSQGKLIESQEKVIRSYQSLDSSRTRYIKILERTIALQDTTIDLYKKLYEQYVCQSKRSLK